MTVTNTDTRPLRIDPARIESTSRVFQIDHDECSGRAVTPAGTCVVPVRFAPARPDVTSAASLAFQTNDAEQTESVSLTGTSTKPQWP